MPRRANPNPSPVPLSAETARVWRLFTVTRPGEWLAASDLVRETGIKFRTATARCLVLSELKLVETEDLFPARKHRFEDKLRTNAPDVAKRLDDLLTHHPE
jgi:hypothetical protein